MAFNADPSAHLRVNATLERFLPSKVDSFLEIVIRTESFLMGSLPLHALKRHWATWVTPGDIDVFLPPTTSSLNSRSVRIFEVFFLECGYAQAPARLTLLAPPALYPPVFSVLTFTKNTPTGIKQIQLISRSFTPRFPRWMDPTPDWFLHTMGTFDFTCCSVAFDGRTFYVTSDNQDPTHPVTIVRHRTTQQRIANEASSLCTYIHAHDVNNGWWIFYARSWTFCGDKRWSNGRPFCIFFWFVFCTLSLDFSLAVLI